MLLYTHRSADDHVNPPGHPEQVARLPAVLAALEGLALDRREAPVAEDAEVLRCHPARLLARLRQATPEDGWSMLDADTQLSAGSVNAALRAVGGACAAVDAVLGGESRRAFVAMRPPGHHAETDRPMGFCLFGTVAIAARRALDLHGLERVAVLDFDVHHGNGTQDCFYDDGQVLFCSTHASPLYPETGEIAESGLESGYGTTLNVPLPHGAGDRAFRLVFEELIEPALREFVPQLILVSAGYDSHWADPLGPLTLSTTGYADLTRRLKRLADELCGGRIALVLEGGYDPPALSACVLASLRVLMEQPAVADKLGPSGMDEPNVEALVERIRRHHPAFQSLQMGWM